MKKLFFLLFGFIVILGCAGCEDDVTREETSESLEINPPAALYGIDDGIYCADVQYYNPNTGRRSSYVLNVEVEDGELTVIHWPSGGWLDDSHFVPRELDEDGTVSFESDRGYEYTVTLRDVGECDY